MEAKTMAIRPGEMKFEVAQLENLEEALRLQRAVYKRDLGHVPTDEMSTLAKHLVAISSHQVVACCRILGPEARPFDLEESVDLDAILGPNAKPALVGRLCVAHEFRNISRSLTIHAGLMNLAREYSFANGITDLILYTYDNLFKFYRGAGFRDTGVLFHHQDWGQIRLMRNTLVAGSPVEHRSSLK